MKIEKLNISQTIADANALIEKEEGLSLALKTMFQLLLTIITVLAERLSLNSSNSSKPPSTDPNRKKKKKRILIISVSLVLNQAVQERI